MLLSLTFTYKLLLKVLNRTGWMTVSITWWYSITCLHI